MRGALAAAAVVSAAALLLAGCGDSTPPAPSGGPSPPAGSPTTPASAPSGPALVTAGSAEKGRQVWLSQCIACHNSDPAKDGPIGPAVKGSSRDLLEARVLRGEYPPGYTPKRPSKVMPPRPDLTASVPDLAAYLH